MVKNVILIQLDSLNRHFLTAYGNTWVQAPNLAAFAEKSHLFLQHHTGSLPCMPARREIWAGVEEFWWRGWGPLESWDEPLPYLLGQQGVVTQLITDHYHFFEWGAHSYHHDFEGYTFIRGHEHDNFQTRPVQNVPEWAQPMIEQHGEGGMIYLRNVQDFRSEEDYFGPRVMQSTADWIEQNASNTPFFLHVDSFDVHEPFHIPEPYRSLYTSDPTPYNPWPPYGRTDEGVFKMESQELEWIRAQFAGKLTMLDRWLGRVFEALDRNQLWDTTAVIITTDHGHYLGEHGRIGKPGSPLWDTLTHIPMMVWHPEHPRKKHQAITQTVDLYATVLDLFGVPHNSPHSRSFLPVVTGHQSVHRSHAVYGYSNLRVGITDGTWTLLRDHDPSAAPAHWYSLQVGQLDTRSHAARLKRSHQFPDLQAGHFIPGVDTPHWKMPARSGDVLNLHPPRPDLLYHTARDPEQLEDLTARHPEQVNRLEGLLRTHMQELGVPPEQHLRLRLKN